MKRRAQLVVGSLANILHRYTDDAAVPITPQTLILSDLGLNSFELAEIVADIEDVFGVVIPDRKIREFITVQDVVDHLDENA